MRQKQMTPASSAEEAIKDIRRATRRHWSAEDKIRIVLEGLRGEESISELCRREGIAASQYYGWSKEFLEAGKRRLAVGNPYVIVGERSGRHMVNLTKPWRRLRSLAGLSDLRLHDLRHNYGSRAASTGHALPIVAKQMRRPNIPMPCPTLFGR
jgi:hypothetical protein